MILQEKIDVGKTFQLQSSQYGCTLYLEDVVPANGEKLGKIAITERGHFLCQYITGSYSTIALSVGDEVPAPVDTGVCYLKAQIQDQMKNILLFTDYVPLNLFLSPGREKSAVSTTIITDPVGNTLFYPLEFTYLFSKTSYILFNVKNESDYANRYKIAFFGQYLLGDEARNVR